MFCIIVDTDPAIATSASVIRQKSACLALLVSCRSDIPDVSDVLQAVRLPEQDGIAIEKASLSSRENDSLYTS